MKFRTDLPFGWRVRAGLAALVIPVLIVFVPLDRLTRWLGKPAVTGASRLPDTLVAAWVDQLLHRLPPPWRHTCLKRCAVLYHLLRRVGREVELVVGVKKDESGALAAHAWLVLDGAPYLETGSEAQQEFKTIARFPEPAVNNL